MHTLIKLPTAFVIKMNVFVLPLALIAARGATAARHFMFLIDDLIWALISCSSQLRSPDFQLHKSDIWTTLHTALSIWVG